MHGVPKTAQAKKEVLYGKEQPYIKRAWSHRTQPEGSAAPSIHMSICAMGSVAVEYLGPAPRGREGVDAREVGTARARLRAGGQPQLYKLVPTLFMYLTVLCGSCTLHIPSDPTRTDL